LEVGASESGLRPLEGFGINGAATDSTTVRSKAFSVGDWYGLFQDIDQSFASREL
jgi:hypothetical protein